MDKRQLSAELRLRPDRPVPLRCNQRADNIAVFQVDVSHRRSPFHRPLHPGWQSVDHRLSRSRPNGLNAGVVGRDGNKGDGGRFRKSACGPFISTLAELVRGRWNFRESPLVDGDKVICTPGASGALLVALDKINGEVIWKSTAPASAAPSAPAAAASRPNERGRFEQPDRSSSPA